TEQLPAQTAAAPAAAPEASEPAIVPSPAPVEPARAPVVDVEGMRRGLARSRSEEGFFGRLRALFSGSREIDAAIAQEIEEVLLSSDVGVATTQTILERIKADLDRGDL